MSFLAEGKCDVDVMSSPRKSMRRCKIMRRKGRGQGKEPWVGRMDAGANGEEAESGWWWVDGRVSVVEMAMAWNVRRKRQLFWCSNTRKGSSLEAHAGRSVVVANNARGVG